MTSKLLRAFALAASIATFFPWGEAGATVPLYNGVSTPTISGTVNRYLSGTDCIAASSSTAGTCAITLSGPLGKVSATSFAGDGSLLTNVSATSISTNSLTVSTLTVTAQLIDKGSATVQGHMGVNITGASNIFQVLPSSYSLSVQSDGNVGVGTDSPVYRLHVRGDPSGSDGTVILIDGRASPLQLANLRMYGSDNVVADFYTDGASSATFFGLNGTYPLVLQGDASGGAYGNVGIGARTAAQKLHMSSGTLLIDGITTQDFVVGISSFVIKNNGLVGIGVRSPCSSCTVHVAGSLSVSAGSIVQTPTLKFYDGTTMTSANNAVAITTQVVIMATSIDGASQSSGCVVGLTTDINGTMQFTSTTSIGVVPFGVLLDNSVSPGSSARVAVWGKTQFTTQGVIAVPETITTGSTRCGGVGAALSSTGAEGYVLNAGTSNAGTGFGWMFLGKGP